MSRLDVLRRQPAHDAASVSNGLAHDLQLDPSRFKSILDAIPAAVYTTDEKGTVTYFNRAAAALAGREPEIGKDRWCVTWRLRDSSGAPLAFEDCPMAVTLRERRPVRGVEAIAERPDGTVVPFLPFPTPMIDADGKLLGAVNVLVDISDRKRAEAALQRESEKLDRLNRIARTLSSDLDLERIVQAATDSATELCGAQFGSFFYNAVNEGGESYVLYALAGAPREAFDRFGLPRNTKVFDPTFRGTGIVRSDDIRLDPRYGQNPPHTGMPKGHLPVVSYLAVPVISRSGEVHGGLFFGHERPGVFTEESAEVVAAIASHAAIAIDNARLLQAAQREVGQRRRAEQVSQQLASIVESSIDAIISKDLDGVITSWNRGAERLFGYSAAEAIGRPIAMLIPADIQNEAPRILERIRRGEQVEPFETIRQRKDGTRIDISLTVSPVKDPDGRIVGASKIARDIGERMRAERALALRSHEQSVLYHFTDRLHRAASVADVYDAALEAIGNAMGCDRASILLFDDRDAMRFVAWRGLSEDYRLAVEGHTPWTRDSRDPEPICIADIAGADLASDLRTAISREAIAAIAFIPLVTNGQVIGKFMAYYSDPHSFTAAEIELAVAIARQLGFGVERMRAEGARRRAEEELRRGEEQARSQAAELQAIMEAVPAVIWIAHDPECRVISGNAMSYDVLRMPVDTNPSLSAAEDPPGHFEVRRGGRTLRPEELPVQLAAKGHDIRNFEQEIHFEDGTSRVLFGNATALRNADGSSRGAVAAFVDLTDRRRAEDALRQSESRLQLALKAGRMGAWEWDLRSGKVIWSPGLEEIHGLGPGTFGGTFEDFQRDIHPDDRALVLAEIEKALATRGDYHVVYRANRADGAIRWLEGFGTFSAPADSPGRLAGVCVDVTERKLGEEQRELLVAELSHRVKNTLATVISIAHHSFSRNPAPDRARRSFEGRIRALAQTHSRLAEANWSGVRLDTVLRDELAPYLDEDKRNVRTAGPEVMLSSKAAVMLGMAIHELATNAAKYGALSTKEGAVDATWRIVAGAPAMLEITWAESNGPPVEVPEHNGFGRLMLERALAADLRGEVRLDFDPKGLRCTMVLPLEGQIARVD